MSSTASEPITYGSYLRLPELLSARGFSDADVAAVMHGNWLRFFSEVLSP